MATTRYIKLIVFYMLCFMMQICMFIQAIKYLRGHTKCLHHHGLTRPFNLLIRLLKTIVPVHTGIIVVAIFQNLTKDIFVVKYIFIPRQLNFSMIFYINKIAGLFYSNKCNKTNCNARRK
jgi:hypothetical protein